MDFWELATILLRRWYAFVPILVATVGLTYLLTDAPATVYHAQSTVLVTRVPDDVAGLNPYARDEQTAQTMATLMVAPEAREQVVAAGGSEVFTVTLAAERSALLLVQGSAAQSEASLSTTDLVIKTMQKRLQDLQTEAGIKPRAPRARVVVVSPPSPAAPETGSRIRELGVGIAVGGLIGVAGALVVEGLSRRRAKKQAEQNTDCGFAPAEEPETDPGDEVSPEIDGPDADPSPGPRRELLSR